jgi:23S rRNA (cytidine1920-2'-O)/16S rRNA (cytidine1409-2'-O)-methyltransferase
MRLDHYLVEQNLVKSRSHATDLIKRGLVLVSGTIQTKPGFDLSNDDFIEIIENSLFVSRAGEKLFKALVDLKLDMHDKIVIDIGSSTGGFTDCVLQQGAKEVYAYDVGRDQMDVTLKKDPRIHLFEETNILDVTLPLADVILIDVSFTSIKPIFKHLKGFEHEIIALIKPQYEAGPIHFKKGVLKDEKMHRKILIDVINEVVTLGFHPVKLLKSELKGKQGNQEYLLYIKPSKPLINIERFVENSVC